MNELSVLIIDDEPDAIAVLEQLLAGIENVKVLGTATTVGAGIRLINECQPHLVLLDVEMPPKSGFDLLAAFPNPDFRVIFATAFDKYAIQAIRYAALDYLVKPVDANELATAISRAQALPLVADHRLLELQTMMAPKAIPPTMPASRLDNTNVITNPKGTVIVMKSLRFLFIVSSI